MFKGNQMSGEYQIITIEKPEESAWGIIGRGVGSYNKQRAGENNFQRICFGLQSADETLVGGVLAEIYWGWLYVDLLWVEESLRGCGHGRSLMIRAESEARERGAKHSYLDTFSFQAPEFYKELGYQVFGALEAFPPGHQRYFMTKKL